VHESIIEYPDFILFDVDPYIYSGAEAKGVEPEPNQQAFEKGKQIAARLKKLLDGMQLPSFVKTSGKTGLHVIVPIRRTLRYDAVREIARTIGEHLRHESPDYITTEWAVDKRRGKVFLDYNMNVRGKSTIAPYGPRGLPSAPVAMPLTWRELRNADAMDYRIASVGRLVAKRGDAWATLLEEKQSVEERFSPKS
jgi:bifunctional non-homologous end joining protein LigD